MRRSIKSQRRKDKATFSGLFERGEIYNEGMNPNSSKEGGNRAERDRKSTVNETLALADLCSKRGMKEEEKTLRELVKNREKTTATNRDLNFRTPTEGMREGAKRMGVDLSDPGVVEMLEQL